MATYHPYHPPMCPADPSGIYAFMTRIDARLDRIENQMKSTDIILGYLVSRVEEIEERLESIEENSEDIENKIDNIDSRFDDVDSKLEDIDMDVLTNGIGETIKESIDVSLDFGAVERMAAMNHNTNIYRAVKDKGNPVLSHEVTLAEVTFPGGRTPTSRGLPLLKNPAVINSLSDNNVIGYYQGYYPREAMPESRDERIKAIWKAIGWRLV
ncbi:hypothetical protein ARMGADRAFT_1166648 [Armillaria gallica]|uniref:Mug135-like C-terminal domain-containing protein n=1 Tax=Armillaria gallica TaxID=47427 RepID=A0A2H3DHY5_ARMGA|nr:hypothetical protein ARMGADRAFT_1166648 [Armillaria gallica]